uniref:Uncharacterized protein n=1 Tax=Aplanochytrium stocchinoi TaxID=215587 RepID=A0A7S3PJJ3_9STRA
MIKRGRSNFAVMKREELATWVTSEYALFTTFGHIIASELGHFHKGNPAFQVLHDGVTIAHKKYVGCAVSFVLPYTVGSELMLKNVIIATGFKRSSHSASDQRVQIKNAVSTVLGLGLEECMVSSMQDCAALDVLQEKDVTLFAPDKCNLHQMSKIGAWAVGDLTRRDGDLDYNPFPEAQKVLKQVLEIGKEFTYGHRWSKLLNILQQHGSRWKTKPLNAAEGKTRITIRGDSLLSVLKVHKGIKAYLSSEIALAKFKSEEGRLKALRMSDEDWRVACDLEAILYSCRYFTSFSQYEINYTGAYGVLLKDLAVKTFETSSSLLRVDLDSIMISEAKHIPRNKTAFKDMTEIGQRAWERAYTEAQKRCSKQALTEREKIAIILDLRTKNSPVLDDQMKMDCYKTLEEVYLKYRMVLYGQVDTNPDTLSTCSDGNVDAAGWENVLSMESQSKDAFSNRETSRREYQQVIKNWLKLKVNWRQYDTQNLLPKDSETFDCFDLLVIDIGPLYAELLHDKYRTNFGLLPRIALTTIATKLSESFCERHNSAAKLIVPNGSCWLSDTEIEMLSCLRMNRGFMEFMKENYGEMAKADLKKNLSKLKTASVSTTSKPNETRYLSDVFASVDESLMSSPSNSWFFYGIGLVLFILDVRLYLKVKIRT